MSSPVAELEAGLQGMLALKPPGVSGSRIGSITTLCVNNVQSESVLIQKIYTHFKKTPGTHKLGVLYVVDSVTRKWMDQAKQQGQAISSSAQDGTFAAGVHRVTELMPVLMNDIIATAPPDQKEKIRKLVDIWEKGQTFPTAMLESFKDKLNAPPPTNYSTTPPGSPPPNLAASLGGKPPPPALPTNIMEALANIARQNTTTTQSNPSIPAPAPSYSMPGVPSSSAPPLSAVNPLQASLPFVPLPQQAALSGQPVVAPGFPYSMPPASVQAGQQLPPQGMPGLASNPANSLAGNVPPPASGGLDPQVQQQLMLVQTLLAQGIPVDKITAIISSMTGGSNAATAVATPPAGAAVPIPQPSNNSPFQGSAPWEGGRPEESRDHGYYDSRQRGRSRSRSPGRRWDAGGSPRGRGDDRGFGDYGRRSSPGRGRFDDRERGRGRDAADYRQRSPGRRTSSPHRGLENTDKFVEFDPSLPAGHIRVLSRTLFVGGVTCSESELRDIFGRYGEVQTCIVNRDKRHAFVKMFTRKDAVNAKEGMEESRNSDLPLRTRWGVGFGPRDCSDYQTGISVIPIGKLTEADRKWMLNAPYGGSGGRPIATGLVVEEPDIEIGAGVSSKAISRRMQTDKGGSNGPKSTRHNDNDHVHSGGPGGGPGAGGRHGRRGGGVNRDNREHRRDDDRGEKNPNGAPPTVTGFPFGISMGPNGMPVYPPGFMFPAPNAHSS